jgi:hypothetical protein
MDIYTAVESAYKNGYEAGIKKFAEKVKAQNGNNFLESWYESADICYEFNQEKFESFIDNLVRIILDEENIA